MKETLSLLLKRGPIAPVQAAGVEQPLAGGVFPLVLAAEREGNRAAGRDVLLLARQRLDIGPRRVRVGFGMIEAQPAGGSGPEPATLIFADLADAPAGQALFGAILNPGALEEAVQAAFVGDPQAAVTGADEGVDAVHPRPHRRPVPAVERPDLVRGSAPDLPVRQFGEADDGLRAASVGRGERSPLLIVVAGGAAIAAHPQVAVLGGEQRRETAARRRVGRRHGQWLETGAIECLQTIMLFGRAGAEGLDAQPAVLQQPQRLERPGGRSVHDRAERAAVRMKLEALLPRLEEQRSILQGKQGADSRGVV